jgi:hypothetical protein
VLVDVVGAEVVVVVVMARVMVVRGAAVVDDLTVVSVLPRPSVVDSAERPRYTMIPTATMPPSIVRRSR